MKLINDFSYIFLNDIPLIDTRAPVEFNRGSFPNATNLPLMTDSERSAVGTCYKEQGSDAAVALGHQLVSGAIQEQRVNAWIEFVEEHPEGALFCFRGGMRSEISQSWLSDRDIEYPRIEGGYKAMRRWLMAQLDRVCAQRDFIVISGKTGSAKTRLINEGNDGMPLAGSVDLEGLANHRGSAFGRRASAQPTQINFEHALAVALLKIERDYSGPIIIEDESRLIGRCALPAALKDRLERSPLLVIDTELEARVNHSFENYILANFNELRDALQDVDAVFSAFSTSLREALARIRKRLGGLKHTELSHLLEDALRTQAAGDDSLHKRWIRELLIVYYDPMYEYQLSRRVDRIRFKGTAAQVKKYLDEIR
ncbi:MAG: tRNA 2-selenouridine(34) synthase MnmH [Halieaceae bacterium]